MDTIENVKEMAILNQEPRGPRSLSGAKRSLEEENRELKKQLEFGKKMQFNEPFWYTEGNHVPYCPSCWESKKLAIPLHYEGCMSGGHRSTHMTSDVQLQQQQYNLFSWRPWRLMGYERDSGRCPTETSANSVRRRGTWSRRQQIWETATANFRASVRRSSR